MRACLFLIIIIASCTPSKKPAIDYFGLSPAGPNAELFAPGIITTDGNEHSAIAFSPDGTAVLWSIMDRNFRGRLLEMNYSNGSWSKPATPSFADTLSGYFAPSFSGDGNTLFFMSRRQAPGYREGRGNRIWSVARTANGWATPVPFDSTVSKGDEFAQSITNSGTMYFSSSTGSVGTSLNIFSTTNKNGKYSEPMLLPYNINTPQYEDGPYISPDEDYLIFESTRPEGISGSHDLYISFRSREGEWSLPVNMGPKINSEGMERFPRVTPDGKYLLFASNRDQSPTRNGFDIYWIDAKVIDELKAANANKLIEQSPGDDILEAVHSKDSARLEQSLKQWLVTYPGNLDGLVLYSSFLRSAKRFTEAEQLLAENASVTKDNTSAIMETAFVKYGLNKNDEAEKLLEPVFSASKDLHHRYFEVMNPLYDMRKYDASDSYFEKAMAMSQNGGQYYNRACGYAHLGETDRVFDLLNKAADNGFNSKEQYENDPDLAEARKDKRYRKLLSKLK